MKKKRKSNLLWIILFVITLFVVPLSIIVSLSRQDVRQHAAAPNASVDFTKTIMARDLFAFSSTISTYGSGGSTIVASAKQRSALQSLGLGLYRVPLQWNGGNPVSAAGGGPKDISGDAWVANIRASGGTPMIVLGGSSDNNFTPSDGANMVRHFADIEYWVIGNEPGNGGMSIQTYCALFNQTVTAMKGVDPTIKVAGPAWAFYDANNIQTFLQCAGDKVDIIDYHHYGMGTTFLDSATALSQTGDWENEVNQVRQLIRNAVPARANQIAIHVGEYNWSWRTEDGYNGWNGDDRFYQSVVTVWGASVAGHIAKAGGRGFQYADQNGALGITFEKPADATHFGRALADPMPIYHGLRMFSGGSLFRSFGKDFVEATTTLPNIEIFASNNDKNIVVINKATTPQTISVQLTGYTGGKAAVWQTDTNKPFDAPTNKGTITLGGNFEYILPAYSVTTVLLDTTGAGGGVAPTKSPVVPTLYCLGSCPTNPVTAPLVTDEPQEIIAEQPTDEPVAIPSETEMTQSPTNIQQIPSPGSDANKSFLQLLLELVLLLLAALASLFRF